MSSSTGRARAFRPARSAGVRIAALAALPVVAAVLVGRVADHPLIGAAIVGAVALVTLAFAVGRRYGGTALGMGLLAVSIVAGEVSAISFGGQSGRILWADVVLGVGVVFVLLRTGLVFELPAMPLAAALLPWVGWSAVTLLFARDVLTGVAELKEWVVAVMVLVLALAWARDVRRARLLMTAVAWTSALVALLMIETAFRSPLGWVLAVLLKQVDLPWGRTNYLAGILILGIPLTGGLLGHATSWKARTQHLGLLLLQVTGLALSASKGAMVALVVGFVFAFSPTSRASRWGALAMLAILAGATLLFVLGPLHQVLLYRLQASAVEYSVGERMNLYRLAWDSFVRQPLLGLGLNNFSVVSNRLTGVDTVPHNLELGLLAELGLPGLVLCFAWIGRFGACAWRARDGRRTPGERALGLGVWAAFVGFFVHNQFESTLYGEQYKILLMMVTAAAAALAGSCDLHDRPRSGPGNSQETKGMTLQT